MELTETLDAIRSGEVDAIIVGKDEARKVYTLEGADYTYQALIENITEGALTLSQEGIILYCNKAFSQLVQVPLGKLLGSALSDHVVYRDRPVFEAMIRGTISSPRKAPIRLRRGSRSVPATISMNSLLSNDTRTIGVIATNRTEDVQALRESEERYRNLFETMGEGFALHEVVCDDNGVVVDYRFLDANPAFERLTGLKRKNIIGKRMTEVLPGEDPLWIERYGKVAMTRKPDHFDLHSNVLDHHYDVFTFSPRPRQFAVLFTDITDRKRTAEALRQSYERIRLAQEAFGGGIWDWNLKDGTLQWDSHLFSLFGLDPGKVSASFSTWESLLHPDDKQIAHERINHALDHYRTMDSTYRIIRPDGQIRWINAIGHGFYDNEGNPFRMTGICIDITERKQNEEALRQSEERFRTVLDTSRDVIYRFNLRTGRYEYISPAAREVTGYTYDELMALSLDETLRMIHPDDIPEFQAGLSRIEKAGRGEIEYRQRTKEGDYRWFSNRVSVIRDDTGQSLYWIGNIRDVTDRKQVEEELRKGKDRLIEALDLLEAVTKGTNVIIAAQDRNFRYSYFNKAYSDVVKEITGKDLFLGMSMFDLFGDMPDELANNLRQWRRVMSGESINARAEFPGPGSIRRTYNILHTPLLNTEGIVVGAGEVSFDITEQAQIEKELGETREYLENLLIHANAPIVVWDPELRISRFNQAFERLCGRSSGEVIGQQLSILFPKDSLDESLGPIRKAIAGEYWDGEEIPVLKKDGGVRTVLWNSAPIHDAFGENIVSVIAQGQDITDRKYAEEQLSTSLQEKEVLLREIHHRVKNNLQLVSGLLDMTRMRTSDRVTYDILTDVMLKIRVMAQIHTRLYESGQFGRIGLEEQITDQIQAIRSIYSYSGDDIQIQVHSPGIYLPVDQAIPCALIVNELLSNVFKHAFIGRGHGTVEVIAVINGGQLSLAIKDDGVGLMKDLDVYKTSSLGIKLVRTLAEHQLKGTMKFESTSSGTEVTVEFPVEDRGE